MAPISSAAPTPTPTPMATVFVVLGWGFGWLDVLEEDDGADVDDGMEVGFMDVLKGLEVGLDL
jgi:hypothetical protein